MLPHFFPGNNHIRGTRIDPIEASTLGDFSETLGDFSDRDKETDKETDRGDRLGNSLRDRLGDRQGDFNRFFEGVFENERSTSSDRRTGGALFWTWFCIVGSSEAIVFKAFGRHRLPILEREAT